MERYVCIHAHFYQPPRENPWLEAIELQDSAYPYHDWNERITAECYAPNMASRILDGQGRIVEIVNNYSRISFNLGPTLLSWLERFEPEVYRGIQDADRESQQRFSGHGSAIAQVYNHMIMPLANHRDKQTQVSWGKRDFEYRFGRAPEGMWLAETAVDLATLEVLAENGIRFTVLAPSQAHRVRKLGRGGTWKDVSGARIDPSRAYLVRLPSGRKINLFFYDGPISRAVAFEGLLSSGVRFAERLVSAFNEHRNWTQLAHIATDGESYGHHHAYGDMALASALRHIETNGLAKLTNYGEFLEKFPPTHEVEIIQETAWSCAHGVERWRGNCGCNSGRQGWNQNWRGPVRDSLDWLRDTLEPVWEEAAGKLVRDPWEARNAYIEVVLDRTPEKIDAFFAANAAHTLNEDEQVQLLKLMELQRHSMLMYTSCGWFFDELTGIETVQVLEYAGRALQLAREALGADYEPEFVEILQEAKSNIPEFGNGRQVFDAFVKPAIVGLNKVGAHYAVSSLYEAYGEHPEIYCYKIDSEDRRVLPLGKARVALGHAGIASEVTREHSHFSYGVLDLGDQNVSGGVRPFTGEEDYDRMVDEVSSKFRHGDIGEVIRALDRHFSSGTYSLKLLFKDEQRKIVNRILEDALEDAETNFRQLYERHATLMRFLSDISMPQPAALKIAVEYSINASLRRALEAEELDLPHIQALLAEARTVGVTLDSAGLGFALTHTIERLATRLNENPEDIELLNGLSGAVDLARSFAGQVKFWKAQNIYYGLLKRTFAEIQDRALAGDEAAQTWTERFLDLGKKLSVSVENLVREQEAA